MFNQKFPEISSRSSSSDRAVAALGHKTEMGAQPGPSTSNTNEDKYDAVYFDSDDEEEEERRAKSRNDVVGDQLLAFHSFPSLSYFEHTSFTVRESMHAS